MDELIFPEFLDLVTRALSELKQGCCEVVTGLSSAPTDHDKGTVTLRCILPLGKHRVRRFEVRGPLPGKIEKIKRLIKNATTLSAMESREMAGEDDTTQPLSKNDEHQVAELASRLEALEKAFEKRGYNTQPMWEMLEERLEKAEKSFDKPIQQIKPNVRQCIYCHSGIYIEALDTRKMSGHGLVNALLDWGISYHPANPSRDWIIFSCNYCGNLQVFNVASVQNTKAWK